MSGDYPGIWLPDSALVLVSAGCWETIRVPKWARKLDAFLLNAGDGGGGGFSTGAATAAGGGGSAGLPANQNLSVLTRFLPSVIYAYVGLGGAGGAAGNPAIAGATGQRSFLSIQATVYPPAAALIISASGASDAGSGGGPGTAIAGGGAGRAQTTPSQFQWTGFAQRTDVAGLAGAAATFGGNSPSAAFPRTTTSQLFSTGTAGGSCDGATSYSGGGITVASLGAYLQAVPAAGTGVDGIAGATIDEPFMAMGGTGGGGNRTGQAGNGGKGGIGAGGGGGGGGQIGGRGGNGGDGRIWLLFSLFQRQISATAQHLGFVVLRRDGAGILKRGEAVEQPTGEEHDKSALPLGCDWKPRLRAPPVRRVAVRAKFGHQL